MNIGSFLIGGRAGYGVFDDRSVAPAGAELMARCPTLRDLLDAQAVAALRDPANLAPPIPLDGITFLPPVPNPRKIVCVGMNYPKPYPVEGVAPPVPEHIILFRKERETLLGHDAALIQPRGTAADSFDYEGEIAVVIGRTARHVTRAEAMDHVLGYSILNDGSVRGWQKHSVYAGKNFAGSGAWGPWITLADRLPPVEDLHLRVELNGEMMQSAFGREMIFPVAEQIAYAASLFTLEPGDVIATGSPDGTGGSRRPPRFLRPGDSLRMRVTGIGSLSNSVASDQDR